MYILTIRTDTSRAQLGLFDDQRSIAVEEWEANRQMADGLNSKILEILNASDIGIKQLGGIAVYSGPGSFTGLRIGASVANALAYAIQIPIVAETGDDWLEKCLGRLNDGDNQKVVVPFYGADPHITAPKK